MTELFFVFLNSVDSAIGKSGAFFISVAILTLGLIVMIFLTIFKRGYSIKKRLWYIAFSIAVCFFYAGYEALYGKIVFSFFTFAIGSAYFAIICFIPERAIKITKEQLQLARVFDQKARVSRADTADRLDNFAGKVMEEKEISVIKTEEKKNKEKEEADINFSHVKSVINRMDYFALTANDKKQVRDLETAINRAERGEYTKEVKESINDGLGALLKIMAKYGI